MSKTFHPISQKARIATIVTMASTGIASMSAQILAGNILAINFGQSLYTWTAVIGTFLAGMSTGNLIGGRLADRTSSRRLPTGTLLLTGFAILIIPAVNTGAATLLLNLPLPWVGRIIIQSILVFFPAALCCGMLPPIMIRKHIDTHSADNAGRIGLYYGVGIIGNLLGTFLTGFIMLAFLPVNLIILIIAASYLPPALWWWKIADKKNRPAVAETAKFAESTASILKLAPFLAAAALTGMAIMILELAAGRLLARDFGQSIYSWTTVIGVVFAGMSGGSILGGRIFDRRPGTKILPPLLSIASMLALATPWIHRSVLDIRWLWGMDLPLRLIIHSSITFAPLSAILGACIPAISNLALGTGYRPGEVLGRIWAAVSAGSLIGTFTAGYLLFGTIGTSPSLAWVAACLAVAAAFSGGPKWLTWDWAAIAITFIFAFSAKLPGAIWFAEKIGLREPGSPLIIYRDESPYSTITVKKDPYEPNIQRFYLDRLQHSVRNTANPLALGYHYESIFAAVMNLAPAGRKSGVRTLTIGGGGYCFPRYIELSRPEWDVDVVEIDPAVTRAAKTAFGLPDDSRIRSYHLDAGLFIRQLARSLRAKPDPAKRYDFIFGDSINNLTVPPHLLTVEFCREIRNSLSPEGIYCLNMIDSLENGKLLGAVIKTCRELWPYVQVISTHSLPDYRDTFVVISSNNPINLDSVPETVRAANPDYLGRLLDTDEMKKLEIKAGNIVLTANFAPVDYLIRPLAREDIDDPAEIHLRIAGRYRALKQYEKAITEARKALNIRPDWFKALNAIGLNHASLREYNLAILAFDEAIQTKPESAMLHYNLGVTLLKTDQIAQAISAFDEAVYLDPGHLNARYNLASLLHLAEDYHGALEQWRIVVSDQPENGEARYRLAMALWRCGKNNEAKREVENAGKLGVIPDQEFIDILAQAGEISNENTKPAPDTQNK